MRTLLILSADAQSSHRNMMDDAIELIPNGGTLRMHQRIIDMPRVQRIYSHPGESHRWHGLEIHQILFRGQVRLSPYEATLLRTRVRPVPRP